MLNTFKIFFSIITTYKKDLFKIIFFELYFLIRHFSTNSKIIYSAISGNQKNNKVSTSTIPCPLYYALIIANFINKNKITSVLDLGSGYGRLTNFLSHHTNSKIYGYEFDKEIYKKSVEIKKKNVILKNKDILKINKEIYNIQCFIFIDPLKRAVDLKKVVKKIKKIKKQKEYFLILINIYGGKNKIFTKKQLVKKHISSKKKGIKIYYKN